MSQFARSGAPMIFCSCGLTSVGTGIVLAGTSSVAGAALCAPAGVVTNQLVARKVMARKVDARTGSSERSDGFIVRLQLGKDLSRGGNTALYLSAASTLAIPALAHASS